MSATNWAECPGCKAVRIREEMAATRAYVDSYGKVSASEYEDLKAAADELKNAPRGETLREDYEVWIDDEFVFHVSYGCSCEECGYEHSYRHEHSAPFKQSNETLKR